MAGQGGLMDELRRAMEELRRAEMQEIAREKAASRRVSVPRKSRRSLFEAIAEVALPGDEESLETDAREEATDYDEDSRRVAAERRAEAVRREPLKETMEEHLAHLSPVDQPPVAAKPVSPLARYAARGAKGGVVLAEILGRPRWEAL